MIKFPPTIGRYLARNYFRNMIFLLLAFLGLIYLFDTVELIRRAAKFDDVPMPLVLQMGLLKLPEVGQVLLPFAILFSAMYTFWQMTARYELVVVRAAGFSVWQFLAPVLAVAIGFGILQTTVINPIGALLLSRFDQLESQYLSRHDRQIVVFQEGLWLRQKAAQEGHYMILKAKRVEQPSWTLKDVTVFSFDEDDAFVQRLDAKSANLDQGQWSFREAQVYNRKQKMRKEAIYTLPTDLTINDVEESFASPQSMSFWRLPAHIQTLEETGFDASRLKVHYHNLLSQPLMLAAMVLLAATVSMRPPRLRGTLILTIAGIFIGFFVFFMSSFLQALGSSQQIPVVIAAWSPALIFFLLGLSAVMNLEDG